MHLKKTNDRITYDPEKLGILDKIIRLTTAVCDSKQYKKRE